MVNKENAKLLIKELIEKYNKVVEEKRDSKYKEEETKKDFILPLFRALGWNVENSSEVTAEETISKKRVDYGFRINGIPKFFLEAKALKADLNDPKFIEQAIDYAWAKGCTWAVLSDFETVMIFNSEWKAENLLQNLLRSISCREFIDRFGELWLLSRESFEQGLIDKEAERLGKKAKLAPIDQQLLDDFSRWRNTLSKNILNYNKDKKLTEEELDEAVQRLLNRLVFIRKAEDAELEGKVLLSTLREWEGEGSKALYVRLRELFRTFEETYDSELFEEALVDEVVITNDVLKEVINGLYGTKDRLRRYDFAIIDADVLGAVYEQYLGHILKKTKKRAEVKESYARRKEAGIYYTPTYIVDYIVRNTLGEFLKDKKADVEKIRVLDPACGSGSFLIKAFDILNEHYSKHDKNYAQTQLDMTGQGTTFAKKVEILRDNIFGVDLDKQAVEIARLNLLLKIAEKGQRLPLLRQNIKCGNSLIDDEKVAGDKAFKWEQEFPKIMKEGGFDVVIGNPPYVENKKIDPVEKSYLTQKYVSAYKLFDYAIPFIEKAIDLLKDGGYFGFIITNKFTITDYGIKIRKILIEKVELKKIVNVSNLPVFKDAATYPIILIFQKKKPSEKNEIKLVSNLKSEAQFINTDYTINSLQQKILSSIPNYIFPITSNIKICKKIIDTSKDTLVHVGKIDYRPLKFTNWGTLLEYVTKNPGEDSLKFIGCGNVDAYRISWNTELRLAGEKYLEMFLSRPKKIEENKWNVLKLQKILVREVGKKLTAAYDERGEYGYLTGIYSISKFNEKYNPKYILALLNSKLLNFYYSSLYGSSHMAGGYLNFHGSYIKTLPIYYADQSKQQSIVQLVDKMLSLNKRLNEIGEKKTDERVRIEEEIKKTDAEINELIYKLHGITESEKKIIEESLK
jgi:type I restriction-modification system DNA methylase subunit